MCVGSRQGGRAGGSVVRGEGEGERLGEKGRGSGWGRRGGGAVRGEGEGERLGERLGEKGRGSG